KNIRLYKCVRRSYSASFDRILLFTRRKGSATGVPGGNAAAKCSYSGGLGAQLSKFQIYRDFAIRDFPLPGEGGIPKGPGVGYLDGIPMPKAFIFELSVEGGMPSIAAAPSLPETFQPDFSRARSILLFSSSLKALSESTLSSP